MCLGEVTKLVVAVRALIVVPGAGAPLLLDVRQRRQCNRHDVTRHMWVQWHMGWPAAVLVLYQFFGFSSKPINPNAEEPSIRVITRRNPRSTDTVRRSLLHSTPPISSRDRGFAACPTIGDVAKARDLFD